MTVGPGVGGASLLKSQIPNAIKSTSFHVMKNVIIIYKVDVEMEGFLLPKFVQIKDVKPCIQIF